MDFSMNSTFTDFRNLPITLKIWIDSENPEFHAKIKNHVSAHNANVLNNAHPNSGFDLIVPDDVVFNQPFESKLINHKIKCAMYVTYYECEEDLNGTQVPCAFYLYPRSSIYKTPLMLANSTGIIDSGYRGFICSAVRYLSANSNVFESFTVEKSSRITQLCHPSLAPFTIKIVETENELGFTDRGSGGFGSTGGTIGSIVPSS